MATSGGPGPSPGRVYGGRSSADREALRRQRLLDAAIDTLIAGDKLTVRGLCQKAGLTSRYFYENFSSIDELAAAAYDSCVVTIATAVSAAFARPDEVHRQIADAMHVLVAQLEQGPRAGHVLFSYRIDNQLITHKRQESTAYFAQITAAFASESAVESTVDVHHAAQFVVGGVTQLLSTWLNSRFAPFPDSSPEPDGELDGPAVARIATTMITALVAQLAVDLEADSGDSRSAPGET